MEEEHQINEEIKKELDETILNIKKKYIYIDRYGVVETTDKKYFNKNEDE